MNKTAIKNYAVWARVQLIEAVKQRAFEYEITEGENDANLEAIGGRLLSKTEKSQRAQLIELIKQKGFDEVMEEAAYTWFNRFIALRFMEVNGFLPARVRVFTDETGAFKPELLKEALNLDIEGVDKAFALELIEKQDNETLYKYLLIALCNSLNAGLPFMFEKIANPTELLFPRNLLRPDSVIGRMVTDIPEEDWHDEVEIIGWIYQYYISEKHEEVVDPLHGKTVKKEDIPAATQLFTTDWVVRYIVDNSLGRYWIERNQQSRLAEKLQFFVTPKDGNIAYVNESIKPEELKVIDPCVGSGHFLAYAFDVLVEIYRECGWSDRDAAKSIIENNLYGLDIDERAAQLACFAVMMKARKLNRRIISPDTKLNITAMSDSDTLPDEIISYAAGQNQQLYADLKLIKQAFINAKEYGSIISVPALDYAAIYAEVEKVTEAYEENLLLIQNRNAVAEILLPLIKQAAILAGKYDAVVTNPPYFNKYSPKLKEYVEKHFAAFKSDLFSVFIFRNFGFCKENGYSGFMTPLVWMFIKSYEDLRKFILAEKSFTTLIQFEYSAFEEATVPICSFVLKNGKETGKGLYFRLSDFKGGMEIQKEKTLEAIGNKDCGYFYEASEANFSKIPGFPVAYWVSDNIYNLFSNQTIQDFEPPRFGMSTSDNNRFLRLWHEISSVKFALPSETYSKIEKHKKWYPYNNGGEFRRWYGDNFDVVNWENDGQEIKQFGKSAIRNKDFYYQEGITWTAISSSKISVRNFDYGFLFSSAGFCIFEKENKYFLLALLNGKVGQTLLKVLSPTLNYNVGDIARIPVVTSNIKKTIVDELVKECIAISREDWDSYETSWDFKKHPLIKIRGEKF